MKDHEIAALVNAARDIAVKYAGTQQLRCQLANLLVPVLKSLSQPQPTSQPNNAKDNQ